MYMLMKIKNICLRTLASLLVFCLSFTFPCFAEPAESSSSVLVFNISGTVKVLPSGHTVWKDAREGMTLRTGDSIRTNELSSAELAFNDKKSNVVKVQPDTFVVLKLKDGEKIELIDGTVLSSLADLPRGSEFEIRTPNATCGARGTRYKVTSRKQKSLTRVAVAQNSVVLSSVSDPDKSAVVKKNEEREISPWKKTVLSAEGTGFAPNKEILPAPHVISEKEYLEMFGAEILVSAKRAARADAYRNLAAKIYGVVIDSGTTLENYAEKEEVVKKKVHGVVRGAKEKSVVYRSDGSVQMTVETKGSRLLAELSPVTGDIFGDDCLTGPVMVNADEFEEYLI